jgi:drug/metabolite transporter (DMT)-like permease
MSSEKASLLGDPARAGILLVIAASFGFASMDAMSKVLAQDHAILQILWFRYMVFTVFALAIARRRGVRRTLISQRPWLQALRALLLVAENAVFVLAFRYLPLADVHALGASAPLMVVALSVVLLGETVGIRRWSAVLVGFVGVLIIIRPGLQEIEWPLLIPLVGALMWALYQILVRLCSRTDGSDTTLLWSALVGLATTSVTGPFMWVPPDREAWVLLVVLAVAGSLAHYALIKGLQLAEASAVQPYTYTLLVFAAFWGLVVFGDIPDAWTILGATIIVGSGLYTWYRERQLARST